MNNDHDMGAPHHEEDKNNSKVDYLKRAAAADEAGDSLLSMYLYLAAFQQAVREDSAPNEAAITGLKQAWALACATKERSLAEYIFELMEPYLSGDEINLCAEELQNLALDKLEDFGFSREELEGIATAISEDIMNMGGMGDPVIKIDHIFPPIQSLKMKISKPGEGKSSAALDPIEKASSSSALTKPQAPADPASANTEANAPRYPQDIPADARQVEPSADPTPTNALAKANGPSIEGTSDGLDEAAQEYLDSAQADLQNLFADDVIMNFSTIAGYANAKGLMRDLGIGMNGDLEFKQLVDMLNAKHGLSQMPALDTLVIRSPAREDANRFMMATLGELNAPTIHMRMEENYQGMPVLCVSAHSIDIPQNNSLRDVFVKGGVLVLEDLDLWSSPVADMGDDPNAFFMMQLTRGAREAVNLISSAVNNPEVNVIVTCSTNGAIDPFFLDMLEPMSMIDIDYPTPEERVEIWMDISNNHPSINNINKADLVRLSANMPRFDIYMAAREAIEEAYKLGLVTRRYQPVTRDNLFDKLAAYQPLESNEYSELEDAVIDDFRIDLSHIDDLLKDE